MPYFAVPRFIVFETALPATENGKIQKFKLRERGHARHLGPREGRHHHRAVIVDEASRSRSQSGGACAGHHAASSRTV